MATQRVSELGTSLTPGFTELLTNWDQVLKSLDRVSAYTAERANEEPSARLSGLRTGRPQLFGETPDGSEWQSRQKPGGYPSKVKEMPEHLQEPRFTGIELGSVRRTGGGVVLERLERRVAQQEAQNLLQLIINSWKCAKGMQALLASEVAGAEVKAQDLTEREKLHRLQELRRSRCTASLQCWQQVQRRDTLSATFQVWREVMRRQAEALQRERAISQSTLDAAQASEVQCQLRRELEKSRAAEEAAAAHASSTRMALHVAEEELARLKAELATSNQLLQVKQAQVVPVATTADPVKESQRSRQLTDLSIKLVRAEAEVSEVKSQVEPLTAQLGMARGQLEVAYALLNKEKGTARDRDLAVTHLWQVLERLQDVPCPENEKKLGLSETSPSAMSTPNIQSSLSLPSLSSASSPSVRSRSKNTSGLSGPEPRERIVQRWTAPWS